MVVLSFADVDAAFEADVLSLTVVDTLLIVVDWSLVCKVLALASVVLSLTGVDALFAVVVLSFSEVDATVDDWLLAGDEFPLVVVLSLATLDALFVVVVWSLIDDVLPLASVVFSLTGDEYPFVVVLSLERVDATFVVVVFSFAGLDPPFTVVDWSLAGDEFPFASVVFDVCPSEAVVFAFSFVVPLISIIDSFSSHD